MPNCDADDGTATPDPCVATRTWSASGDAELRILTSRASRWAMGVRRTCSPISTGRIVIKNALPEDERKRALAIKLNGSALALPHTDAQLQPDRVGGEIRVSSLLSSRDTGPISLPASDNRGNPLWRPVGPRDTPRGWRYSDRRQAYGPCRKAVIRLGKAAKIKCTSKRFGSPLDYDLSPGESEGQLSVVLTLGSNQFSAVLEPKPNRDGRNGRSYAATVSTGASPCSME